MGRSDVIEHPIATLINFSSNEAAFLAPCLQQALTFSKQVIVCTCDHFFDGTVENLSLLDQLYAEHPHVEFVEFSFDVNHSFYRFQSPHFLHNIGRMVGIHHLNPRVEYVLFLDVDEILDAPRWLQWLKSGSYLKYSACTLACYWYFREPIYQALHWEDTPLLVKKNQLSYDIIMHPEERYGTFLNVAGDKKRMMKGSDEQPMIHHYSWVRTKEQMLKKVMSWGHRDERNWKGLVEEEFSHPFQGKDFVHGYRFIEVPSFIDWPAQVKSASSSEKARKNFPHVKRLTAKEIQAIDLRLKFNV